MSGLMVPTSNSYEQGATSGSGRDVPTAQTELLDSSARYTLRNEMASNVMTANPILQAVHHGTKASPIER
jgi:hypothetical protein